MITPNIAPRKITGSAAAGLFSAAKSSIRRMEKTTDAISKAPDVTKEQKFGMNYVQFFGSKKNSKILKKSLKSIRDSLVATFEIAKLLRSEVSKNVKLIGEKTKKNVFSSREYSFHVSFAFKFLENGQFESLLKDSPMKTGNTRSQEQTKYYHPDGSVYFLNMTSLMNDSGPSIYINAIPFKSSSKYFIDIDDQSDLEYARFIADLF